MPYILLPFGIKNGRFSRTATPIEKRGTYTLKKEEEECARVQFAFAMLNIQIATASAILLLGPDKEYVIIVYASEYAISASPNLR